MSASTTTKYTFLDPPTNPDDLGVLGPYRVINELGRGGMGFVFRAEDTRLKRIVALKVMNEKIAATPHSRCRFIEEARSMAAVKHDNVATIYEVNDQCNTPFMAMEMLKGGTLEELTRRHEKLNYQQVIQYAIEMARGLAAAHAQGIIHRDIKPANIWIEAERDRIKILDFGLALVKVPVDQLAGRGSVIGTPQYLSPEQARSEPLDDRSDLYSLGVVLFELCTGDLPFKARTVLEQLMLTLVRVPPPVNELNPDIPKPLAKLISCLIEKEPRLRPRSALELEKMLEKSAIECEAKSDVALAINKLQAQLNLVTVKQTDPFATKPRGAKPSGAGSIPASTAVANPFDALPSAVLTTPALNPARAAGPASPPASKGAHAANRNSRQPTFGQAKAPQPSLTRYWPVAAAAGVGVLVLFVALSVFLFSSGSPDQIAVNTIPSGDLVDNGAVNTPPVVSIPSPDVTKKIEPDNSNQKNRQEQDQQSTSVQPTESEETAAPAKVVDVPMKDIIENSSTSSTADEATSSSASDPADDVSPAPTEVLNKGIPRGTPVVTVRTSSGRGADTTVKRAGGTGGQLGENITVVVQTRGEVDVQHSYLRFDLNDIKQDSSVVSNAELVLSLPGGPPPVGSIVRVYGVPEEYPDAWSEVGPQTLYWDNSTSRSNLEGISLLAEVELSSEENSPTVRIHDQRLTDFIQSIHEKFVTLVLAGGSPGNKPLHFVSREGGQELAPALDLVIQDNPNKKK